MVVGVSGKKEDDKQLQHPKAIEGAGMGFGSADGPIAKPKGRERSIMAGTELSIYDMCPCLFPDTWRYPREAPSIHR